MKMRFSKRQVIGFLHEAGADAAVKNLDGKGHTPTACRNPPSRLTKNPR